MWCGHAASALNPVTEAVTDNKCLDILAQSAEQCKGFLILFFSAQAILYIKV
jgi:predicted nucleic acid-binding Zn ribbon protein